MSTEAERARGRERQRAYRARKRALNPPRGRIYTSMDPVDRFMRHVAVGETDECWEWTASRNSKGYGQFGYEGRPRPASRVAAVLMLGLPLDSSLHVCHTCDNRLCVNPNHLFFGTNLDNMADCKAKGRFAYGSRLPHAKLTEAAVAEVRELARDGFTRADLAQRFGVTPTAITLAVNRKTWRHVA